MRKNNPLFTAMTAVAIAFSSFLWTAPLHAQTAQEEAAFRSAVLGQMSQTAAASKARADQQDQAALQGANCENMKVLAERTATQSVELRRPPDPTKIIQNTTCFSNISQIKIPVSSTGIGLLDSIISSQIQQYMKGTCQKAQAFLGDIKRSAIGELNSVTGGRGALAFNYATQLANGADPDAIGANAAKVAANVAVNEVAGNTGAGRIVTNAVNGGIDQVKNNGLEQTIENYSASTKKLMCGYGVADPTACPTCMSNPTHSSCIGPRPLCSSRPDLPASACDNRDVSW